jgi:Icc protein
MRGGRIELPLRDYQGLMCQARLDWLEHQLLAQPDEPTLLFMHHPPFETGIEHMDA